MSDTKRLQISGSVEIRTRIAKLLYSQNAIEDDGGHVMRWDDIDANYQNCWYRNADAVIAELNLVFMAPAPTGRWVIGHIEADDE